MKTLILATLAANLPQFIILLFWLILALWLIGLWTPFSTSQHYVRGSSVVIIILLAIVGYASFGFGP